MLGQTTLDVDFRQLWLYDFLMRTTRPIKNKHIKKAVDFFGGQTALAKEIGATQQQIWNWLFRGDEVPVLFILKIEKKTNKLITRHDINPDINWEDVA